MKSLFSPYPRVIFTLLALVFLMQNGYDFVSDFMIFQEPEAGGLSLEAVNRLLALFSGLSFLIAGFLADKIESAVDGLKWGAFATLIGFLLTVLPFSWVGLIGAILANVGFALLTIFVILHIAVLFPVATDLKDNAFMMLMVVPFFGAIFYPILMLTGVPDGAWFYIVLPVAFFLAGIALLFSSKNMGYSVGSEGEEFSDELPPWKILWGLTAFAVIVKFAVVHFQGIGNSGFNFSSFISTEVMMYTPVILLVPLVLIVLAMLGTVKNNARQIPKALVGMAVLMAVFAIQFVVRSNGSWELDHLSDYLAIWTEKVIFLPILLSALTHVNFDKKAGLWVSILMGVPILFTELVSLVVPPDIHPLILPGMAAMMLIAAFIFLRENREFISNLLRLEEPNQEADEASLDSDPIDHLVGEEN